MDLVLRTVSPPKHAIAGAALVVLLAACGKSGSSNPPWGLDGVRQPTDAASITRVLGAMPATVAERDRASSSGLQVAYGERDQIQLGAMRLGAEAAAEGFPATADGFLQMLARSGEVEVEAQQLDPVGELVYVASTTTSGSLRDGATVNVRTVYLLGWGEPNSEWLFSITADSPESRIALAEAFVEAVGSAG